MFTLCFPQEQTGGTGSSAHWKVPLKELLRPNNFFQIIPQQYLTLNVNWFGADVELPAQIWSKLAYLKFHWYNKIWYSYRAERGKWQFDNSPLWQLLGFHTGMLEVPKWGFTADVQSSWSSSSFEGYRVADMVLNWTWANVCLLRSVIVGVPSAHRKSSWHNCTSKPTLSSNQYLTLHITWFWAGKEFPPHIRPKFSHLRGAIKS